MRNWILVVLALIGFVSCNTDVELYADYKDVPVVYGLIDAQSDTNFIKITKAFCGTNDDPINANEVALIYDSSNYPYKLNVYIEELKATSEQPFQPTGRRFQLDTLTIHNKEAGAFYSPDQILYYTTARFNTNDADNKYRYKLYVVKPDGDTVTAETSVLGGNIAIGAPLVTFVSSPSHASGSFLFTSTDAAVLYEFGMRFNYREVHPGQPEMKKQITWNFGAKPLDAYEKVAGTENIYEVYYSVNTLFNLLERAIGADTVWDDNHPNVIRYIDDFEIFVSASAEDFYIFYQSMHHGLSLSTEYSNVKGGCGLFSSRIFVKKIAQLSSRTQYDLFSKPWGFQEQ